MANAPPAYEPEPEDSRSAWADIRRYLKKRVSPQWYQNWLVHTAVIGVDKRELRVRVPDAVTREWIEAEWADDMRAAIAELGLDIDAVVFVHIAAREVEA
jgi:chromosomal replication initiation ATPase DnaA